MKTTMRLGLVTLVLLLLAACAQAPLAELSPAASVENDRDNVQYAYAYITDYVGGSECEGSSIETFYIQNELKQPKREQDLFYIYFGSGKCDESYVFGEYVVYGPELDDVNFSFDKNLKTARLAATFEVMDCSVVDGSTTCVPAGTAEATVNWTGIGEVNRDTNYLFHTRSDGGKRTIRGHGSRREAMVTITVNYGGETVKLSYPNSETEYGLAFLRSGRYSTHVVD